MANLISLCERFSPRFSSDDYATEMLQKYKDIPVHFITKRDELFLVNGLKAHFTEYPGFSKLVQPENFNHGIIIVEGHLGHLYEVLGSTTAVERLKNSVWIVVPTPANKKSIMYKRLLATDYDPAFHARYTFPLVATYKDVPITINELNGISFDAELFCSETGVEYLRTLLLDTFNVKLPDIADEIHSIWFSWMKTTQEAYDRVNNMQS